MEGIIGVIRKIKNLKEKDLLDPSLDPKDIREKLDPELASAIDFATAQDGNYSVSGEAGAGKSVVLAPVRMMV